MGEGDVVSWQLPTWFESMVLVGALARLGAIQNPIIPIYREREVGFVTKQAGAKLLVVPSVFRGFDYAAMADTVAGEVDGLDVLVVRQGTCPRAIRRRCRRRPPRPTTRPTSRSAGSSTPRARRPTRRAPSTPTPSIAAVAEGMGDRSRSTPDDRSALVFPFTHIGGIIWLFTSLQFGCVNLFVETFDPATTVPSWRENGVTLAGAGTPFHMAYLAAQRAAGPEPHLPERAGLPRRRRAQAAAAALRHEGRSSAASGIVSGYGLTEAPILIVVDVRRHRRRAGRHRGPAMPGVELKLVTLDGQVAGPGEEGEIRAKAPQMMKGYLDSSLDADAFDEDGYFRTGDLGEQDDDGYLIITGRLKDVIIRKGENISAKEVEDLLFEHPKVGDVAVIGLPDERTGERVVRRRRHRRGPGPHQLRDHGRVPAGKGLSMQKIPEQLEFIDVLPRNPTGKVLKYELRDQYAD